MGQDKATARPWWVLEPHEQDAWWVVDPSRSGADPDNRVVALVYARRDAEAIIDAHAGFARAEAERDERQAEAASMAEDLRAAEEENKRLREALNDLVEYCTDGVHEDYLRNARAALRGEAGA